MSQAIYVPMNTLRPHDLSAEVTIRISFRHFSIYLQATIWSY